MPRPGSVSATPFVDRLRSGAGRRTLAIGLALCIEGILLLLLLSLGSNEQPAGKEQRTIVVNLRPAELLEKAPEADSVEPEQETEARPEPQRRQANEPLPMQPAEPWQPARPTQTPEPVLPQPAPPQVAPALPPAIPAPAATPPSPSAAVPRSTARPAPSGKSVYGPPDSGGPACLRDTERVGTAPNGEPMYAAAWYREPRDEDLRDYLSTAHGPGWGLIACRTAPNYRVEDCVALSEYPQGSQINRAILAAAWEFRVRPPQRGGTPLVGSWVRIRIDYSLRRR